VLAQVVAAQRGAGTVTEAARGDAIVFGVDGEHAPALAVAHRTKAVPFGDGANAPHGQRCELGSDRTLGIAGGFVVSGGYFRAAIEMSCVV